MEKAEIDRDKLIDELLKELYQEYRLPINSYLTKKNLAYSLVPDADRFAVSVIDKMNREDLIVRSTNHVKEISDKGKAIVESGGWLEYLKREKLKAKREEERNHWESQLTKWNVKTRWWPLVISIASFVLSVLAFTVSLRQDNMDKGDKKIEELNPGETKISLDSLKNVAPDTVTKE